LHAKRTALIGVLIGTAFWGLSGTASQALFQTYKFPVLGLSELRLAISGFLLLAFVRPSIPKRKDLRLLVSIAIFGFVGTQVSYLVTIQYTNAPTATLLQFLFLPMVAGYEALTGSLRWSKQWTVTLTLAFAGTLLLIGLFSGGGFSLVITPIGLVAGLIAAVTGAYYSLATRPLVREKGGWWLTTWGFLIGGLVMLPLGYLGFQGYSLSPSAPEFATVVGLVIFVIIFGTVLSFGLYMVGLERLPATETGVAASIEPIVASIAAYVFLGVRLAPLQYLGGALILLAVILIASRPAGEKLESYEKMNDDQKRSLE
jgi:drug/metabolite transporter (DMT)-like permease